MRAARLVLEIVCVLGLLTGAVLTAPFWITRLALARKDAPHVKDARGHYNHP